MNYLVTLSYDGSQFHGWAKQNNVRTIQEEIEKILERLLNQKVTIYGSGRTDAYVHALAQTFSFNIKKNIIPCKSLLNGLKSLQPSDIDFISVKRVDGMFNARFSCKCKTYRYVINNGEYDVFKSNYEYFYKRKVNISLLKKGLNLFKGEHDFKSFSTSVLENTKRIIYKTSIVKKGHYLYVEITGNGFLRNMVRMIMGSLIDLNEKKKSLNDIKNLLNIPSKGSAIAKIKACGLYLVDVKY